jgi:annexin A7/11
MKGFGTNEAALMRVLCPLDPLQMAALRTTYHNQHKRDLVKDIEKETGGYFKRGLVQLVRGPLTTDAYVLHDAMKGLGTKEAALDDVLMGRSNADIKAIKQEYHNVFGRTLESDLKGDLSMATEDMFLMVVSATRAEDSAPVIPQEIDADVQKLHSAVATMNKDTLGFYSIFLRKSDAQLRTIAQTYQAKYGKSLESTIKDKFSGHMEDALVLHLNRALDRPKAEAEMLEDAMAGLGTKDQLLVDRVVRAHWNRQHMQNVKVAYQRRYGKSLVNRIKGETRGDYEKLMVTLVDV